jgi:microcystin-dependent protein
MSTGGRANTAGPLGRVSDGSKLITLPPTSGAISTATGGLRVYNDLGEDLTISQVRISAGTAPTGSTLIVDLNQNGTTVFTTQANRPAIAISGNTAVNAAAPDVATWAAGNYLTYDVDQIGSTVAGSNLTGQVVVTPATLPDLTPRRRHPCPVASSLPGRSPTPRVPLFG